MRASPHISNNATVSRLMQHVLFALSPGILTTVWLLGPGILFNLLLAVGTAVCAEVLMLKLRQRPIMLFLRDYSAIVSAVLLAICLPPMVPWWIPVIGSLFAIVIAKHVYGGLGYNPFNPAMVGFVVLLIAFPAIMSRWLIPPAHSIFSFSEVWQFVFSAHLPLGQSLDSLTTATPLDTVKTQLKIPVPLGTILQQADTQAFIRSWQWINLAYLLGGLWLIYQRVIQWLIPVAVLTGLCSMALVFALAQPAHFASPWFHLLSGATMVAAFFIATDPVTAATTVKGRIYYGLGIGLLIYVIRTWGGYPDGIAFAVLLMNMAVPIIDQLTQPKIYGSNRHE